MMRSILCSSFIVGLAFFSLGAGAQVKSEDFSIHEEYVSTRALGMGNAFTAVADDFSAIFYNPANLANRTDGQLRMFIRAGADADVFQLPGEIKNVDNMPQANRVQGFSDLITEHYGDHFFARAPTIGAAWVRPGWGIAFIPADLSIDIDDLRQIGPALNVNTYLDSTLAFSYAQKLGWFGENNELSWGTTLKAVHRVYVGQEISAGELANGANVFSTANAAEGLTGDIDLGTYWTPPLAKGFLGFLKYMRPHFALVGRNLIDNGFKTNLHIIGKNTGEPPPLIRRFDAGSKFDLPKWWVFDPHFSADIRDMGHPNWSIKKGTHAGIELYWKMYNWWKGHWAAGINQGYWTAGFGARFAWFQLDLASYGEEVGADSTPMEDRRYMIELALDF